MGVGAFFLTGVALGLSAAVPIGPVNLTIMRRGLAGGFVPAFLVGLGAATIDVLYGAAFTYGFTTLADPYLQSRLGLLGATVLLVIGAMTVRDAFRPAPAAAPLPACDPADLPDGVACPLPTTDTEGPLASPFGGYVTGLSMTATNPMTLAFWASVGVTATQLALVTVGDRALLLAGILAGALSWVVFFAALLHKTRHRLNDKARRVLTAAGGLGIIAFAFRMVLL